MVSWIKQHTLIIVSMIITALFVIIPRLVLGQDLPDSGGPAPGGTLQIIWIIIQYGGGAVVITGVGWGASKLIGWLNETHKNKVWSGFVVRFVQALDDAFNAAWEKLNGEIAEARDPNSPGGTNVTNEEAKEIGDEMIEHLKKTYGGWTKLTSLVGNIIGGDAEKWVKDKVKRKVKRGTGGATVVGPRRDP